ncbi:MAG TPA: hypothetical protein PLP29_00345 [Candidatus Ozemobacteraceae bacterium]|nr:hypothetical protein [Candidatus Ozemobacteraceae bacterium]
MLQRIALLISLLLPCLAGSRIIGRIDAETISRELTGRSKALSRMVGHGARLSQVFSWSDDATLVLIELRESDPA